MRSLNPSAPKRLQRRGRECPSSPRAFHMPCTSLESSPQPGDLVAGKYRIDHVMQHGGMSMVLAATHVDLGQRVAIKLLCGDSAGVSSQIASRFLREARAASAIQCVHGTRILDVGQLESGLPYLVMEQLDGADLETVVREQGPLQVTDAVDYVLQACKVVTEAHALGIVHRDIKPSNLFLTTRPDGTGFVKVLDFGISKVDDEQQAPSSLTATTMVMGTPSYMAPEQLRSAREADARSDIWALGVTLFELLTGRPPFQADTITALCAQIIADEPPALHTLRAEAPEALSHVIAWTLRKDPAQRPQNVGAFARALAPFASPSSAESIDLIVRLSEQTPPSLQERRRQLQALQGNPRCTTSSPPCRRDACKNRWAVRSKAALAGLIIGVAAGVVGVTTLLNRSAPSVEVAPIAIEPVAAAVAPLPQEQRCERDPLPAPAASHTSVAPRRAQPVAIPPSPGEERSHGPLDQRH